MRKLAATPSALKTLCLALALASFQLSISAQAPPAPDITGEDAACAGATHYYATEYHPGNSWVWTVSPGGTATLDYGNFIAVHWTGAPNSSQWLTVTETDAAGASGADLLAVLIKNNQLACENHVNVSLDQNGQALITPDMLLDGTFNTYEGFVVTLSNVIGFPLGNPLGCANIGQTITGKVTDPCTGNSCWSAVTVEDKKAPLFQCPAAAVEVPCDTDFDNYPPPPVADNCDGSPTLLLAGFQIDNSNVCGGVHVTKHWVATDDFGNSSTCTQQLFTDPGQMLDFPDDRLWNCETYSAHPNVTDPAPFTGNLAATGSGIPAGASGAYCPFSFVHHDDTLSGCGSTFKILRTWTVLNWCAGTVVLEDANGDDGEQIIKVADATPPLATVPPITLNANLTGALAILCASTGFLPAPAVSDECGGVTVQIFTTVGEAVYQNGTDGAQGGNVPFPGLKIGSHLILYKVTDACGNVTELQVPAQVADSAYPTVICDEWTSVNLDVTGFATVFAQTFDDGSHDNCCLDQFVVKRLEEPASAFAPSIVFNCLEDTVMVVMRAYDCFGNWNECMVQALVKDKTAPTCLPPPPAVIPCTSLPPDIEGAWLQATFGSATTFDNCGATLVELPFVESLNGCGEGNILRQFAAVDAAGNISGTCSQYVYVTPVSDYVIHFPADWSGDCGEQEDAQDLTWQNTGCTLLAVSHEDQFFPLAADSACYKIVRTWKVVNWCLYDPYALPVIVNHQPGGVWIDETTYGSAGHFEYQQVVKVKDDTPPALSFPFANEYCSTDADCATGSVFLPIQIDGECSDNFTIVYHLDLHTDLTYDLTGQGFFEGELPLGSHRIRYLVQDGCGNNAQIAGDFSVLDCKAPVAACNNGLIVEIMQAGSITICAESFNYGSFDNCHPAGSPGGVTFSFSENPADSCRTFLCNSTFLDLPIQLWVTDAAGNMAFCETTLYIQDNMFACANGLPVNGLIATEQAEGVAGVEVQLNGGGSSPIFTTGESGDYEFEDLEEGDYTIAPSKDNVPLNGVSTFDLVLVSRHILGVQPIASPYNLIAADVNRSGGITTYDLVEMRKLILLITAEFPNNTSWRFVAKGYVFPNPANPWQEPFPEVISINNLNAALADANFVAIKIGDINGNADTGN